MGRSYLQCILTVGRSYLQCRLTVGRSYLQCRLTMGRATYSVDLLWAELLAVYTQCRRGYLQYRLNVGGID